MASTWHHRNKENAYKWQSEYKKQRRQKIKDYLGGKCVGCGTTENLQFDHLDRTQKEFNISRNVCMAWDKLTAEADKCQLLCKDCHNVKTLIQHDSNQLKEGYKVSQVTHEGDEIVVRLKRI